MSEISQTAVSPISPQSERSEYLRPTHIDILTNPIFPKKTNKETVLKTKIQGKTVNAIYGTEDQIQFSPTEKQIYFLIRCLWEYDLEERRMIAKISKEDYRGLFGKSDSNQRIKELFETIRIKLSKLRIGEIIPNEKTEQIAKYSSMALFPNISIDETGVLIVKAEPELSDFLRQYQRLLVPKEWVIKTDANKYRYALDIYEYISQQYRLNKKHRQPVRFGSILDYLKITKGDKNYGRDKKTISIFITVFMRTELNVSVRRIHSNKSSGRVTDEVITTETLLTESDKLYFGYPEGYAESLDTLLEEQKVARNTQIKKTIENRKKANKQTKDKPVEKSPKELEEERKRRAAII